MCLLSRKAWCVVQIGSFCPKLRYFSDQNGPKGGPHQNKFWLFSNEKMNVTISYSGKSRWKNWGHLSILLPELCSVNCPKRCILYNFLLTSAKNLSCWSNLHICIWKFSLQSFRKCYDLQGSKPAFMKY